MIFLWSDLYYVQHTWEKSAEETQHGNVLFKCCDECGSRRALVSAEHASHQLLQLQEGCCRSGGAREERDQSQGLQHLLTTLLVPLQCGLNTSLYHFSAWSSSLFCQMQGMLKVVGQGCIMSCLKSSWWCVWFLLSSKLDSHVGNCCKAQILW